jgi:heat shock protein HslJ
LFVATGGKLILSRHRKGNQATIPEFDDWKGRGMRASRPINALFEGGKVGGFSGVNTYQGSYRVSGTSLSIGKLASTLMAGPQDLMDAEQTYLAALQQTDLYSADPTSLTLFDNAGKRLLVYARE